MAIGTSDGQYFENQWALTQDSITRHLGGYMSHEGAMQDDMAKAQEIDVAVPRKEASPLSTAETPPIQLPVIEDPSIPKNAHTADYKGSEPHPVVDFLQRLDDDFFNGKAFKENPKAALMKGMEQALMAMPVGGRATIPKLKENLPSVNIESNMKGEQGTDYRFLHENQANRANDNLTYPQQVAERKKHIAELQKQGIVDENGQFIVDPGDDALLNQSWKRFGDSQKKAIDTAAKKVRDAFEVIEGGNSELPKGAKPIEHILKEPFEENKNYAKLPLSERISDRRADPDTIIEHFRDFIDFYWGTGPLDRTGTAYNHYLPGQIHQSEEGLKRKGKENTGLGSIDMLERAGKKQREELDWKEEVQKRWREFNEKLDAEIKKKRAEFEEKGITLERPHIPVDDEGFPDLPIEAPGTGEKHK